ncbi:MAG TPA: ABC transporter ATP-binding protein [Hyphomicrobiaceae bacterium]|nr:ABC transporter ATP-binding protein [Hyphomicrobiaceae bacterium]
MTALIEAKELRKSFGELKAVDGISLHVPRGEVLGFLGPNGAGKSTTMKMLTGFLEPDSGSARIAGYDVLEQPKLAKAKLGYLPEGAPLYAEMTPRNLLLFVAGLRGFEKHEAERRTGIAVERTGLEPVLDRTIETLSKGFKRRVGLAQAIVHDPEVLIMDEPTDGLDPNQKHQIRRLIQEMAKEKAIVISTHILEEVEAVCTRAIVINKGRIVADGTAEDLMRRVPYHGAVAIRVATGQADAVKRALEASQAISKVETVSAVNGQSQLRALPKNGAVIATDVASLIREKSIVVDEIYVERGKLDDVFRQITTPEQDAGHA